MSAFSGVEVYVLTMRHTYSDYERSEQSETIVGVFNSIEECNKAIVARHFTTRTGDANPEAPTIEIDISGGTYVITKSILAGPLKMATSLTPMEPDPMTAVCPHCGETGLHIRQFTCPRCIRQTGFPQDDDFDVPLSPLDKFAGSW